MLQIVVLPYGHVVIGQVSRTGDEVVISAARIIRRWGTSRGLAQLANDGPQIGMALEDPCDVEVHRLAIVMAYRCDPQKWRSFYGGE